MRITRLESAKFELLNELYEKGQLPLGVYTAAMERTLESTLHRIEDDVRRLDNAETISVDGLLKVSGCDNPDRVGDVVFVHGLGGDPTATWQHGNCKDDYWPSWLGERLPDVGIWSLGYSVNAFEWKGGAMPLADRATNALASLEAQGIGLRPTIFVTHSFGGLLVKQMLRHARELGCVEWHALANQTRGVVFISTPHSGSNVATWAKHLKAVVGLSCTIEELASHESRLRELNLWYRHAVEELSINTQVYFETKKVYGVIVVDASSADPGLSGVIPIPVDDHHTGICQPASKTELVFARTLQFVRKCLLY